ncbi:ATP phosphoribosyltransferase [Rhizobiales bacterium GAS191]|jgi:ATP phosphoribosyltransferase|nr:ATP phosphoribosyltransferase [Rhizobiales bacterium GAS188]SEC81939.1 ATP phosphoribosyltransferase [Rhizobiales bacterium GAS191]
MNDKLIVAVPSKGRLQERANAFFARAGLRLQQQGGARDYRGAFEGVDNVEILFLSASEITSLLASGGAHIGVTGEDLVRETVAEADRKLALLAPLGFGNANVVVAVPRAWIDVRCMADLDDVAAALRAKSGQRMRVATKYVNLTRRFFGEHGLADYRIVESSGATEGAPASGAAEIIVDITTTGTTLAANALKTLDDGTILRSEAQLVASLTAAWSSANREAARSLLQRITAEETARALREIRADVPVGAGAAFAHLPEEFGAERLEGGNGAPLRFFVRRSEAHGFCDWLIAQGATTVTVAELEFVYTATNALWDKLRPRLEA